MRTNFYLRDNSDRFGKVPIFLYISIKGQRFIFYTGIKIDPGKKTVIPHPEYKHKNVVKWSNWNEADETHDHARVKGRDERTKEINLFLSDLYSEVDKAYTRGKRGNVKFTKEYFKQEVRFFRDPEPEDTEPEFFEIWEKYLQFGKTQKSWSEGTVRRMNTLRSELDKLGKIEFRSIDESFLERFLQQHFDQGWLNSYTAKNYKLFKGFLNWATRKGYNKNLTYQGFEVKLKVPRIDDNIYTLQDKEMDLIMNMKVKSPEQEVTRDCFIFQCYSSMRFGDMLNLKSTDINTTSIHTKTQKTGQPVEIPLNNILEKILQKYEGDPSGKALPVISNQKYNKAIQRMGKDAKLNRIVEYVNYCGSEVVADEYKLYQKMTSHTARKTYIKIGLIYLGIPVEKMIKITGHSLAQIRVYYDLSAQEKEEIAHGYDLVSKHNYLTKVV